MNGDRLRTYIMVLALAGNAAAWVWGAGSRQAHLDARLNSHQARLDRMEVVLEKLVEQQSLLARNLDVLTAIVRERTREMRYEPRQN